MKQRNCLSLLRRRKNQSLIPCRYPFKSTALQAEVWEGGILRRYVSLREPHLRLCTFASPRRAPSGHEQRRTENRRWAQIGLWDGWMRPLRGREESWGGCFPEVYDPGLCYGYAPHTLICCTPEGVQWEELRSLRLAVEAGADALHELHDLRQPEGIGSQEVADAGQ